jgi:multidrug/hemolysin transport system permease protein
MRGALAEMEATGIPHEVIEELRDALDCNLYFFGAQVSEPMMYAILGGTIAILIAVYIVINRLRRHV